MANKAFEYKTLVIEYDKPPYSSQDDQLNEYGADGWELVASNAIEGLYEEKIVEVLYLKREVNKTEEVLPVGRR